ncbi:Filamin-B [Hypsibius exemplaris]|uniref:Filamin-B n=1 Tax=Hypsibius exemplaris TaxID=2072580 RepID=A0A1W0X7S8_HYPEX|nr:Filamin-B [Hypsibius exemplaris]
MTRCSTSQITAVVTRKEKESTSRGGNTVGTETTTTTTSTTVDIMVHPSYLPAVKHRGRNFGHVNNTNNITETVPIPRRPSRSHQESSSLLRKRDLHLHSRYDHSSGFEELSLSDESASTSRASNSYHSDMVRVFHHNSPDSRTSNHSNASSGFHDHDNGELFPSQAATGAIIWCEVDTHGQEAGPVTVRVRAPSGKTVPVNVTGSAQTKFRAEYIPVEIGPHIITVLYAETPISGSPFTCNVYDATRIRVSDIPHGIVGRPVKFQVDASQAGEGKLDVNVSCRGAEVPAEITSLGRGKYEVVFIPREVSPHFIDVQFNDTQVEGAPFRCEIIDGSRSIAEGDGLKKAFVGENAWFEIDPHGPALAEAEVKITSPSGGRVVTQDRKTSRDTFRFEYVPTEPGPHKIVCKYAGTHLKASPFLCDVYDIRNVRVSELADGYVGKESTFQVDTSTAGGPGEVEVEVESSGRTIKATIRSLGRGLHEVAFTPKDAGPHGITVKFMNRVVPGSPFKMTVHDPSQIRVSGDGLKRALVETMAWFEIDPRGPATGDVDVKITSPSGSRIATHISKTSRGVFRVEFTPLEVGPHKIACKYANTSLTGSPFTCEAYDPRRVKVSDIQDGFVGRESIVKIDATMAGVGEVEVTVESQGRSLPVALKEVGEKGSYEASFTPREAGQHGIKVTFASKIVPGSPFKMNVYDPSQFRVTGDGLKLAYVGETAWFEIDPRGATNGEAGVKITSPSGARIACQITRTSRGIIRVEYVPSEVGPHRISTKYAGNALLGSPFTCEVIDPRQVHVTDLHDGYVGKENVFRVDASKAGAGDLEIEVEGGKRRLATKVTKSTTPGVFEVAFTPRDIGQHDISVKFHSRAVPGSPFKIAVHDGSLIRVSGDGLKRARVGTKAWFNIRMEGGAPLDGNDIEVHVVAPNGTKLPVKLSQQGKSGDIKAEFVPKIVGPHRVEVTFVGAPVSGSPWTCEAFDPSLVRVKDFPESCYVGETGAFEVSSKEAGKAELSVKIFGPSGQPVPVEILDSYEGHKIRFTPTESGKHKLHIQYGGEEVPGSPFTFMVDEPGIPTASGDGLLWAMADEPAHFRVDAAKLRGKLEVTVHGPNRAAKTTITPEKHGIYKVTYIAAEVGVFDVKIVWNGKELPDSPYHPKVFDPTKVRVVGGWPAHLDDKDRIKMRVGDEKKLLFDIGEAGPGKLSAEVRGPSGLIPVRLETSGKDRVKVSFTPVAEGHHDVHFWYSEQPIPHSPLPGWAEPALPLIDASRVRLRGRGLTEAKVREEAEFIIDGSEAGPGEPEVHISGIKADIPVSLQHLGSNVYKATYTASHHGAYQLVVKWSGEVVKGCPYKLNVAAASDASKVVVATEELKAGVVGKKMESFIDTRRAGPGELSVHCMGPTKQAFCELYDHHDGTYTLAIRPAEAGRHLLTIKYNGEHVPGSPFAIKIQGTPDASKVRVYGPGVNHGVLATYQSRFMCETKGAGAGQLTVRVRGPKGAFRVEMQRESQKDRTILCKYDPTEPGDYKIEVKWSGEHVPGSPFNIWIFDTEEELNRFLRTGEVPSYRPTSPLGYPPVAEYYGNGAYSSPQPPGGHPNTTPYSQWRRGSADI